MTTRFSADARAANARLAPGAALRRSLLVNCERSDIRLSGRPASGTPVLMAWWALLKSVAEDAQASAAAGGWKERVRRVLCQEKAHTTQRDRAPGTFGDMAEKPLPQGTFVVGKPALGQPVAGPATAVVYSQAPPSYVSVAPAGPSPVSQTISGAVRAGNAAVNVASKLVTAGINHALNPKVSVTTAIAKIDNGALVDAE